MEFFGLIGLARSTSSAGDSATADGSFGMAFAWSLLQSCSRKQPVVS